jgi:hypothetical protein
MTNIVQRRHNEQTQDNSNQNNVVLMRTETKMRNIRGDGSIDDVGLGRRSGSFADEMTVEERESQTYRIAGRTDSFAEEVSAEDKATRDRLDLSEKKCALAFRSRSFAEEAKEEERVSEDFQDFSGKTNSTAMADTSNSTHSRPNEVTVPGFLSILPHGIEPIDHRVAKHLRLSETQAMLSRNAAAAERRERERLAQLNSDEPDEENPSTTDPDAVLKTHWPKRPMVLILASISVLIVAAVTMAVVITNKTSPSSPHSPLFHFLAASSLDRGADLSTNGSSQQRAMQWLETRLAAMSTPVEFNYPLSQLYALGTLYFQTIDNTDLVNKSATFANHMNNWLRDGSFCDWHGVLCDDQGDVSALQLAGVGMMSTIPAEMAILNPSLSKSSRPKIPFS